MRRALVLLAVLPLVFVLASPAQARLTGEVCQTFNHNGDSQTICVSTEAQDDPNGAQMVRGVMSGHGEADRVWAGAVYLYRKTGPNAWILVQGSPPSGFFNTGHFYWTTNWEHNVDCVPPSPSYHGKGEFRIYWSDGAVGPLRFMDANDAECAV